MVGKRRQRNLDHTSQKVWKDSEHEYAGQVFSVKYKNREDLFQGLRIWEEKTSPEYRKLQGTYPVLFLSFADVKETSYEQARKGYAASLRNCTINTPSFWREIC